MPKISNNLSVCGLVKKKSKCQDNSHTLKEKKKDACLPSITGFK